MEIYPHIEFSEDKGLLIGGIPASRLALKYGTPLYVYSEDAILEKMREYASALSDAYPGGMVAYAGKAYLTMRMAELVAREGLYLDVASGGELYIALQAGFPPARIVMHGNNKSADELAMAVAAGAGRIVVDNLDEMANLQRIAQEKHRVQDILIRLTPGIDPHTHRYLTTGEITSKFGVAMDGTKPFVAAQEAQKSPNLNLLGFHCHIGSQIFEESPFVAAARVMMDFVAALREKTGIAARELDLGGGLGVRYTDRDPRDPSPTSCLTGLCHEVKSRAIELGFPLPRILVEPGRSIVAASGVTLYTVGSVKELPNGETVAAVDGGMADNPRPALYGAKYCALPGRPVRWTGIRPVRIVGKHCEEGDTLIEKAHLPPLVPGDLLAIPVSGAYQYSMRSNYNALPCPAVVHIAGGQAFVVVERQEYRDLIAKERPVHSFPAIEPERAANAN